MFITIMFNIFNILCLRMNLVEIGGEIHDKRLQSGLLQEHVARLAGISRVTMNQLENGSLNNLGYTKLKAVMDIVGLDLKTVQPKPLVNALVVAARSVSTSYKDVLAADTLAEILRSGSVPQQYQPHIMVLLDETPLSVVVQAISAAATAEVPAKVILKHLSLWAKQWKTHRAVW